MFTVQRPAVTLGTEVEEPGKPAPKGMATAFKIEGAAKLASKALVITLAGEKPVDENTLDELTQVMPIEATFEGWGRSLRTSSSPIR